MSYKLTFSSSLFRDRQDEPPLALCPECLGEIYEGEPFERTETAVYHAGCMERMMNDGDRGYLPPGES